MTPYYQDASVTVLHGDCLDVLRDLPDNSVDAICTDPPYGLEFMGKEWDSFKGANDWGRAGDTPEWTERPKGGTDPFNGRDRPRFTAGHPFQQWCQQWATEALRVLKPGGHMLAFGGTRTYHRLTCGIEDAGFEIRDCLAWLYGSGFPKSLDVSKAIDKTAGRQGTSIATLKAELRLRFEASGLTRVGIDRACGFRASNYLTIAAEGKRPDPWVNVLPTAEKWARIKEVLGCTDDDVLDEFFAEAEREAIGQAKRTGKEAGTYGAFPGDNLITAPATDAARQWQGWGTALKPAHEPIVMARKPLQGTVAGNVQAWGTGGLNIDGCRIATDEPPAAHHGTNGAAGVTYGSRREYEPGSANAANTHTRGRWPANVTLDEAAAQALDQQSGESTSPSKPVKQGGYHGGGFDVGKSEGTPRDGEGVGYADSGGASRFFYTAKAGSDERISYFRQSCECEDAWPTTSPARDIAGTVTPESWNTSKSGSGPTAGESPTATRSTTSTATSSTTTPPTSSHSPRPITSASTPGASFAAANGGSPAASAESSSPSALPTGTSVKRDGRSTGAAARATSRAWSETSACGNCGAPSRREAHATVKPLALMRWLTRLVTPPGGLVLDMFAGSGATVEAALLEGFRCIAIEREPDYLPMITQRIHRRRDPIAYLTQGGHDLGLFEFEEPA